MWILILVVICNIPIVFFLAWVVFDNVDGFIDSISKSSESRGYRHYDSNTRRVMQVLDDPVSAARGYDDDDLPSPESLNLVGFLVAVVLLFAGQLWLFQKSLYWLWALATIAVLLTFLEIGYVRKRKGA